MPLGRSGGRSARNKQSAVRRSTPRERSAIDPPGRSEWVKAQAEEDHWSLHLTTRGHNVFSVLAWSLWLVVCVMFAIVICAWWGLL